MPNVHCFTSASLSYLDKVRVLGETIRRHHPEWTFTLCLSDREPPGFRLNLSKEPFDHIVRIDELGIPDLPGWIFQHDVVELCTAVKGAMLWRLLESGADRIIYLDPDIAVFAPLSPIVDLLEHHPVVLTPHQIHPETAMQAVIDNEIGSLKHGVYNLGFLAIRGCADGRRFGSWWRDRLMDFCFDDIPGGLFTDQRWCDLAPALFDGVHILRDPGYNVASWNLGQRPLSIDERGAICAGNSQLRFFHFTKISHVGQIMLERYSPDNVTVFELVKWYCRRLAANKVQDLPEGWWAFNNYDDGTSIPKKDRIAYRSRPDLRQRAANPFADRMAIQSV